MSLDILIIGGGLAGLTSAIDLSQKGLNVVLLEKNEFPRHKVCGEYVSNEVLPYLHSLGFDPFDFGAKKIDTFLLSSKTGTQITSNLPLGGFSMSRYTLDTALAEKAKDAGVIILYETVSAVTFDKDRFQITTKNGSNYLAKMVIGAYGKRSNLDKHLNRQFIKTNSAYLAVKAHYKGDLPDNIVALHNFKGGYCGLSKVENDRINACYIVDYKSFKKHKNIDDFQQKVLCQNPLLKTFFDNAAMVSEKPLTISQISFSNKRLIEDHVLMCGDSAGMIHPLCGNGMSMAIQSAQLVSSLLYAFFSQKINSRTELELAYQKAWNQEFRDRLRTGRLLARLFRLDHFSELLLSGLNLIPNALPRIIEKTHGKPLVIA
ncbi:MAG: NAD(P)/FAD-dependent oxidoreductase [Flavobacteriaceae bacterium]|nr:NAD(P)/FAD-dependent oxidoreductase [Flavobacteriaceae bacterium]